MTTSVIPFAFDSLTVRATIIDGEPWFVPTGFKLDADSLKIWELGVKAWEKEKVAAKS